MITKEQVLQNIENNKHVGDSSPWISAGYFMTGNGLLDSIVVNATAKETSFAFETALKTGVYKNHSILGGNFLYNFLYNSTPANLLTKKRIIRANSFSKKLPFGFRFNFLSNNVVKAPEKLIDDGIVKTLAERMEYYGNLHHATPNSELVRGGIGIGKDYSRIFDNFRTLLGDEIPYVIKTAKGYNGWSGERLGQALFNKLLGGGNKKLTEKEILTNLSKFETEDFYYFFNTLSDEKLHQKILNGISEFKSTGKISNESIKNEIIDNFLRYNMKDSDVYAITKIADDLGIKINPTDFKSIKEATEKIGAFFGNKNTAESILSAAPIKTMVGVASPLNLAALGITAASVVASIGQDNAINNFISSHLYNTKESENLMSAESMHSINSAYGIQEANLKSLSLSYSDINTARRYMNDLDPISLDLDSYHLDNYDTKTEND